ncbi:MAG: helix-turn-helix domain-containing protein [Bacteroidota bacterium]
MKKGTEEPEESMLTQSMDVGTAGFDEFQAILLKKAGSRTEDQKRKIDLLTIKYEMEDYLASDIKEEKKAGDFLREILKKLNIQQKLFAEYLGLKPSNLSKLISGERTINYDLALIFSRLFNHSPMLWIEIQAKNELYKLLRAKKNEYSTYSLNSLVNEQRASYQAKKRKKGKEET